MEGLLPRHLAVATLWQLLRISLGSIGESRTKLARVCVSEGGILEEVKIHTSPRGSATRRLSAAAVSNNNGDSRDENREYIREAETPRMKHLSQVSSSIRTSDSREETQTRARRRTKFKGRTVSKNKEERARAKL